MPRHALPALSLALGLVASACVGSGSTAIDTALVVQGVPESLAATWVTDVYGQTWLDVDWDAMRSELLHPEASDAAVQLDCAELKLDPIATMPGACAVPGTPDPDRLIAQGHLDEVIWAVGFLAPVQLTVAVHHATQAHWTHVDTALRPANVLVQGTATWGAVSCPGDQDVPAPQTFALGRQLDRVLVVPRVGPTHAGGSLLTDRIVHQRLGRTRRMETLGVDDSGELTWTGETRTTWTETAVHWTTSTGLVGDAHAVTLGHDDWQPRTEVLCQGLRSSP